MNFVSVSSKSPTIAFSLSLLQFLHTLWKVFPFGDRRFLESFMGLSWAEKRCVSRKEITQGMSVAPSFDPYPYRFCAGTPTWSSCTVSLRCVPWHTVPEGDASRASSGSLPPRCTCTIVPSMFRTKGNIRPSKCHERGVYGCWRQFHSFKAKELVKVRFLQHYPP